MRRRGCRWLPLATGRMRICCLWAALAFAPNVAKTAGSRLTHDEQKTMMSMWSMLRSPLIFGGDLPSLDPFTRSLLTNTEVLNIDQNSLNTSIAYSKDDLHIWTAKGAPPGVVYAALFNFSDSPAHVHMAWSQLGITVSSASIRELWTGETLRGSPDVDASVAAHGVVLYKIERHR